MSRRTFRVAVGFSVSLLCGCATLDPRPSAAQSEEAGQKSIAVASVLGPTFHGRLVGTTVFNNEAWDEKVPEWDVNTAVIQTAVQLLRTEANLDAKPLPSIKRSDPKPAIEAARAMGADVVIVVRPATNSNQPMFKASYGLFQRSFLGNTTTCLYSVFIVEAFDVESGDSLGWRWSFDRGWSGAGIPCEDDKSLVWRKTYAEYSAAEKAAFRVGTLRSLAKNLRTSLTLLEFLPPVDSEQNQGQNEATP